VAIARATLARARVIDARVFAEREDETVVTLQRAQEPDVAGFDEAARAYDALLVLSFGGPERPADVLPFLENVTRGRGIPQERLAEVAAHYLHFGGVSPINRQNRALIAALGLELRRHGIDLPIYFGNRNWHPRLEDALAQMEAAGARHVLVFVTAAFSSYSGCRQYREDISRAIDVTGATGMRFDKIRVFYNHPGFIAPMAARLREALASIPAERHTGLEVVFTAHSIPRSLAQRSAYERHLQEACRLVAALAAAPRYRLAWQSRSGPPETPWLEPDIIEELEVLRASGVTEVIVVPIGFISDHLEVLYDLDVEAQARAAELGVTMTRVSTVGPDPAFVAMIRELIQERMTAWPARRALGALGPSHDICSAHCCPAASPAQHSTLETTSA